MILPLEKQVSSLELSKRLRELGVKQQSLFYWNFQAFITGYQWVLTMSRPDFDKDQDIEQTTDAYSAFTVAELGEILPEEIEIDELSYWINIQRVIGNNWGIGYRPNGGHSIHFSQTSETEADAHAKMLIYLLENKLITL